MHGACVNACCILLWNRAENLSHCSSEHHYLAQMASMQARGAHISATNLMICKYTEEYKTFSLTTTARISVILDDIGFGCIDWHDYILSETSSRKLTGYVDGWRAA